MEVLNLSIEFHSPEGTITKKIVRLDNTTKISEVIRLLLEKFGRASDSSPYQLSIPPNNSNNNTVIQLTDLNKTLSGYYIKNNDELVFKKKQKKANPAQAKLSNKNSIFKTLFSMSTIEFKLGEGEGKGQHDITEVENSIEDPTLLFKAIDYLTKYFQTAERDEIVSSFKCFELNDPEYVEFMKQVSQMTEREIDFSTYKSSVRMLCNFIFHTLHISFSQTQLTSLLKPSTPISVKSSIFYEVHPKNRVILKHIMIFLSNMTEGDPGLLDSVASVIAPFVIGSQTPPIRGVGPISPESMSILAESVGQHNTTPTAPVPLPPRPLSQEEIQLCKKVVIDLIQNIHIYLLFSPQRRITRLEGEVLLFSTENIYCIDKCNFPPPGKPHVGELWVTNYRIIFVNTPHTHQFSIPHSTSSTSNLGNTLQQSSMTNYSSYSTSTYSSSYTNTQLPNSTSFNSFSQLNYSGMSSNSLNYNSNNTSTTTSTGAPGNITGSTSFSSSMLYNTLSTCENTEIPLSMIYRCKSIKTGPLYETYKIYCKDFRCKVIGIPYSSVFRHKFRELLESLKSQSFELFAYSNQEPNLVNTENFAETQLVDEYNRMGVSWDSWRVTQVNNTTKPFQLCESYPLQSVVPKSINDNQIVTSAYYRKGYRFPILCWSHPTQRSSIHRAAPPDDPSASSGSTTNLFAPSVLSSNNSTPAVTPRDTNSSGYNTISSSTASFIKDSAQVNTSPGTPINKVQFNTPNSVLSPNSGATSPTSPVSPRLHTSLSFSTMPEVNQQDIDFLKAILDVKPSNLLLVFDTGNPASYVTTMIGCKVEFLKLQSPQEIKDGYNKLIHLHLNHPDKKWHDVIRYHWLGPMKEILIAACNIASNVDQGRTVLIQSASPDADTQLSSLAQLLLDPYYRTVEGFKVLIEKEWVCYGHPFNRRSNHRNTAKFDNDGFSPIFTQFLFLVWQIWREFPSSFQFNESYLLTLADSVYSGRFGTFLLNSVKERASDQLYSNTKSFWSFIQLNLAQYTNSLYVEHTAPLKCQRQFQDTMWNEYFYRYCFKSCFTLEQLEENIKNAMGNAGSAQILDSASQIIPLDVLDCSQLKLFYLPSTSMLYQFSGTLRELNLSRNNLNSIPLALSELIHLERLIMEENYLTNLPSETIRIFSNSMKSLIEFNFSYNLLTDLPMELGLFSDRLLVLSLKKNPFITIPEVLLASLCNLVELDLSECEFSSPIPIEQAYNLKKLSTLNLSNSKILNGLLPKEFGDITQLEKLFLDYTLISGLPDTFAQLTLLEDLSLSSNQLQEFPMPITSLTGLRKLNLENNQISQVPDEISNLAGLTVLNLKTNKLSVLPASIGQLSNLTDLNLMNNQLIQLRPTMGLLDNLVSLKLDGNRLKTPPPEIISQGLKPTLYYLKDLIKGSEPLFKMKLMIVGQENVGKTTLVRALKEKKKVKLAPSQNISTDGIAIDNLVFQGQFEETDETGRLIKKKQDVTLSIWDFAGQEIYYTTHQFFLSERSLYIVVWNIILAEEESRVEFWLQSITSRAKDAPIIIVGTHLDDSNRSVAKTLKKKIRDKYCTRFPNIKAVKLVSCLSGKGIPGLRETLESIVVTQRNMGESLPRSYLLLENIVKEELQKRVIPTIPWPEFIQLGKVCTISDEKELLRATLFLHQLGSLVYFPKEPGLRDFVIIDPEWITKVLATIITTKHSYGKDGILYHKSLRQIWRPPQFPQYLHVHLLSLLEKFEISYALTNASGNTISNFDDGVSLIPSLLGADRPTTFDVYWKPYNSSIQQFGRIYVLEFVPNGFFSRLMVRILNFARAEAKCYWKNGMILQRDQEQILLEMNNLKKTLSFTVRGSNSITLSRDITETIQSLLDDSFNLISLIYIPCIHCIQLNSNHPYKFPIEVCENAAVKGIGFVKCQNINMVRTDLLVPDLVMTNFSGERIPYDQIQMVELIGEGGAALVYRGRYKEEEVAVKKLKTINSDSSDQPTDINEASLSRAFNEFRRECWVMSNLEHPNIVQLKGLCLDPLCIVTEYLPHGNLYNFLHKPETKFSWIFRLKVALDISSGMAFLHSSTPPIIHRDLKSPNILLASLDESSPTLAKVVDFGLSGLQHTITNRGVENPLWLAPEILSKTRDYSTCSDVYAFGVILWELLTCRDYFGEISFLTVVEEKVIAGSRPDIPEDCHHLYARLIKDCWQQDPDLRPKFPQIEETIMEIIETMFPDLYLSQPNNHKEKRMSLRSSLTRHHKHPSVSSEISEMSNDFSTDTNTNTLSNDPTALPTHDNVKPLTHNHSIDSIIDATTVNNNNNNNNSTMAVEEKDKTTAEIIEEIQNMPSTKKIMYMNNNPKRNSVAIQPFHNEFNRELESLEGSIYSMIQVGSNIWVGTGNGIISIWNIDSAKKVHSFQAHSKGVNCLYLHMNTVWSGSFDTIRIWNVEDFEKLKTIESNPITCFVRVGHTIWAGSSSKVIDVYDIKKKIRHKVKIQLEDPVQSMLKRDGEEVWVSAGSKIARIDINSHRIIQMINAHDLDVHAMIQVENTVWSCASDGAIKVWNNSGSMIQKIQAHNSRIFAMTLVGDYVWSGGWDCSIKIWSTKDYQNVSENTLKHKDAISTFVYIDNELQQQQQTQTEDPKKKKKDSKKSPTIPPIPLGQPKKQVWSGSFDSSICIWSLPNSSSFNYIEDLLRNSSIVNSTSQESLHNYSQSVPTSHSSVLNTSGGGSQFFNFNSQENLSPPSSSPSSFSGTLGRTFARRTVSFVFGKSPR